MLKDLKSILYSYCLSINLECLCGFSHNVFAKRESIRMFEIFINLESLEMLLNQNIVPIKPTFVLGNQNLTFALDF